LTILSFALRVYQLDAKSIWFDESHSLNRASLDLLSIASGKEIWGDRVRQDTTHVPFYFFILHFLIKLAGDSDFTLRFLSVIFGVLTVPLIYFMGKKLCHGDTRVGLWAALLATFSPFYLWYSQEARMYALLVFLGLLSVYCLLRAIDENKTGWYAIYAMTATAMLYTSLFSGVLFVFEGLLGLLAAWKRRRWVILAVFVIISLAFLPGLWHHLVWLTPERQQLVEDNLVTVYNYWPGILQDILNSFNFGLSLDPTGLTLLNLALLVLFAIGLLYLSWDRPSDTTQGKPFDPSTSLRASLAQDKPPHRWNSSLFLLGYIAIPVISMYLVTLRLPIYRGSRYLMIISPAYYLGLAAGLVAIKRRTWLLFLLCLSLILGGMLLSDHNYFFSPDYIKEDYRSVARHIERHSQVGDVIVGSSFDSWAFPHYYRGHLPVIWIPRSGKDMLTDVQELAHQYDRIWLLNNRLFEHDPQEQVETWLDDHLFKTTALVFHSYGASPKLSTYLTTSPLLDRLPAVQYPLEASFGGKIVLRGGDLPLGIPPAGERLRLTLYLQAEQAMERDYKISVRLVDGQGHLWGQYDNLPLSGAFPTSHWSSETIVREWCDLAIQLGTPPGTYQLEMRMYQSSTAEDLEVFMRGESQGKAITLGQVEVSEPTSSASLAEIPIEHRLEADWDGGLKLLGYDFATQVYQSGDGLTLSLYYQAVSPPKKDYLLRLQLVDRAGAVLAESLSPPGGEAYPTSQWGEGVIIKSQHGLAIPPDATGGKLKLRASLVDAEGEPLSVRGHPWTLWAGKHLDLTAVWVSERERSYQLPPIEHAMRADLGDQAEFHGYSLESAQVEPGGVLRLALYWQARQRMTVSYTVFTHLLGKDGAIWGQRDNIPVKGTYPTTGWREGEVITDEYELPVKSDTPPSEYQIEVGMYDATTGQRLPVFDEGGTRLPGDRILLDRVITVR
jgi:hypothetical protein